MLAHFYTLKHAQNQHLQAFFSLTSFQHEVNKMQQSPQSAHPAQNTQANGIVFAILFSLALLLAYAVNHHLVTDCFVGLMSLFFDSFSVKTSSILTDIVLLIAFTLMIFGLFCAFRFFLPIALTFLVIAVIAVMAWFFLVPHADKTLHDVKNDSMPTLENARGW